MLWTDGSSINVCLSPSLWFLGRGSSGRGSVHTVRCSRDVNNEIVWQRCEERALLCERVGVGQLYVSNVKFQGSVLAAFVNEVLLVWMHACACVFVLLRVCFLFNAIVCRRSARCGCALTRKGTRSLLGNTRPRRSAVSSSGIGWRSAVGGNLVTNYNLGSQVLTYWCKSAAWWSAEPQQPVRGDALDVHCCTADRLTLNLLRDTMLLSHRQRGLSKEALYLSLHSI